MTTTAFDDQFTPATQTILRVNKPGVIESQQQVHALLQSAEVRHD